MILDFADSINDVNAEYYYERLSTINDRRDFVDTLEYILNSNRSLWFTPYGDLYLRAFGIDCKLSKPLSSERQRIKHYTVVIYNRYTDN